MKKAILLLTAIMLVVLSAGCENVSYEESRRTEDSSVDFYEYIDGKLPDFVPSAADGESAAESNGEDSDDDYGYLPEMSGYGTYTIVTDDVTAFYQDEENPGTISTAIQHRNQFLKQKYGADIEVKRASLTGITNGIKKAAESGTEYCDLISISGSDMVSLYLSGLLYDLNTLPEFDPKSDLFDEKNSTALATNSTLYMIADPSALVYDKAYVLFYNRKLLENTSAPNPEELVLQGKWTWDAFNTCVKTAAAEVYSKTSANLETDIYGFSSYYLDYGYSLAMWYSSGKKIIGDTYNNKVSLSTSSSGIESIGKTALKYYNVKGRYPFEGEDARTAFESGRLAFLSNRLDYLYSLRDGTASGTKYGFLPMPKFSEEQENYACLLDSSARVFAMPKTIGSRDDDRKRFAGIMLSAICAVGRPTIRSAFISSNLALYLYDNTETVILETIADSIVFDFANVYGTKIERVANVSSKAVNDYYVLGSALSIMINRNISQFQYYSKTKFT